MRNPKLAIFLFALIIKLSPANGQGKADKFLDLTFSPSLGFRLLGNAKTPENYPHSNTHFRDSLNNADGPGKSFNFGIQLMSKKNAIDAFSIGLSFTSLRFRRVRENLVIGDEIHPDAGIIAGVIQAGRLAVNYDYTYRYVELPLIWYKSTEGLKRNFNEFDLWYFYGFAPAVLVQSGINIRTEGFTLNGANKFYVKDKQNTSLAANLFLEAGYRADYYLYKSIHLLFQPRLRIPVAPSTTGNQTVWLPQLSMDLGLVYPIQDRQK